MRKVLAIRPSKVSDLKELVSDNSMVQIRACCLLENLAELTDNQKEIWKMVSDPKIAFTLKAALGSTNSKLQKIAWKLLEKLSFLTDNQKEIWGMVSNSGFASTLKASLVSKNTELKLKSWVLLANLSFLKDNINGIWEMMSDQKVCGRRRHKDDISGNWENVTYQYIVHEFKFALGSDNPEFQLQSWRLLENLAYHTDNKKA